MDLSDAFDEPATSDLVLRLVVEETSQSNSCKRRLQARDRSFFVHAIVIRQSAYLRARISCPSRVDVAQTQADSGFDGAVSGSASCGPASKRGPAYIRRIGASGSLPVFEEHVEAEELDAVELVLRSLYRSDLPAAALGDGMLLMLAYRVADRFQVPGRCMDALAAALCALQGLDVATLRVWYSLEEGLRSHDRLAGMRAKGTLALATVLSSPGTTYEQQQELMVQAFGDVPSVIASRQRRDEFCAVPFEAVLAWTRADDLKVHSENCVVFLLSAWVQSRRHAGPSSMQLDQLARHVRVVNLSPAYLHSVLPNLRWFHDHCTAMKHLAFVRVLKASPMALSVPSYKGPPAWLAVRRTTTGLPTDLMLEWAIGAEQLEELHGGRAAFSQECYVNGLLVCLALEGTADHHGEATVGLFIYAPSSSARVLGLEAFSAAIGMLGFSLHFMGADGGYVASGSWTHSLTEPAAGLGNANLLRCSGSSTREVVSKFLVQGKLHVRATNISFM